MSIPLPFASPSFWIPIIVIGSVVTVITFGFGATAGAEAVQRGNIQSISEEYSQIKSLPADVESEFGDGLANQTALSLGKPLVDISTAAAMEGYFLGMKHPYAGRQLGWIAPTTGIGIAGAWIYTMLKPLIAGVRWLL